MSELGPLQDPKEAKTLPAPSDVAAVPNDVKKTASGLERKVLTPGTGKEHPGPDDKVKVHYTGWTTDGKMFDSSVARGEPTSFRVSGVIKGWTEGLQLMTSGRRRGSDPRQARVRRHAGATRYARRHARLRCRALGDCDRAEAAGRAHRCQSGPRHGQEDRLGACLPRSAKRTGARHPKPTDRVKCTTRGGSPTARCSTAPLPAANRRRSASTASSRVDGGGAADGGRRETGSGPCASRTRQPRVRRTGGPLVFDIELLAIETRPRLLLKGPPEVGAAISPPKPPSLREGVPRRGVK